MSWAHRVRYLVLGLALVAGLAVLPTHAARADTQCANHCVILIEVNGLENKDVTPQSTPFLWALAHPGKTNASATPALSGRSGWMWQASRGIMSSSTAASTASLLTGGFPEETGVPADEYLDRFDPKTPNKLMRLGDPGDAGAITTGTTQTLIQSATQADVKTATFIGDPALRTIVDGTPDVTHATYGDATYSWYPAGQTGTQDGNGDPKLCPAPSAQDSSAGGTPGVPSPSAPICPANDLQTSKEMSDYLTGNTGANISLTYAYLAELGIAKQHNGNSQASSGSSSSVGGAPGSGGTPSVAQALQDTDAAIAQFVVNYQTARTTQWNNTVMMVVGNHGYELTPTSQRVPAPDASQPSGVAPNGDLATYVDAQAHAKTGDANSAQLIPQGSMATIYYTDTAHPEKRADTLADLRTRLLGDVNATPPCKQDPGGTQQCIAEVLYVNPADVPADHPEYGLTHQHPSWRQGWLNYKACDTTAKFISPASCPASAGNGGDLLVIMEPGWAPGRATPAVDTSGGVPSASDPANPYPASEGGPRNRSIAAIVDGPSTGNLVYEFPWIAGQDDGRSPVTLKPDTTSDPRQENNSSQARYYGTTGYDQADGYRPSTAGATDPFNSLPGDDAIIYGAPQQTPTASLCPEKTDPACGHERQAQTVDFMPTIAALMKISVPSNQLAGRILQEPFGVPLALFNDNEDIGIAEPPPPPPPPPAPVVILPPSPPPPPPTYNFHGLIRNVRAEVGELRGSKFFSVEKARPGADLSSIQLTADFGRPETQVVLTLYRKGIKPGSSGATKTNGRRSRRPRARRAAGGQHLVTLVRFCGFSVKRGPGVQLRFKMPLRFAPDHIGLSVKEIKPKAPGVAKPGTTAAASTRGTGGGAHPATATAAAKAGCAASVVKPIGRPGGAVVPIRNAALLHTRKRAGARKPGKRPGGRRPKPGARRG